jgi:hypothetical protein
MTVRDNIFRVSEFGGARLYMAGRQPRVLNNLFRVDPRAPKVVPRAGILIRGKAALRVPMTAHHQRHDPLRVAETHPSLAPIVVSHRYPARASGR